MDSEVAAADNGVDQVRDLLEHLYDPNYLQHQPFVRKMAQAGEGGATQVRRLLLQAIEFTSPGNNFYFREPQARPYQMLQLHYVERLTIQKAALELGVSERQAYRDLRQGEENVLAFLNSWVEQEASTEKPAAAPVEQRPVVRRGENLVSLIEGAMLSIERLATKQGIVLDIHIARKEFIAPVDPAIARQVLVSLLSRAVQQAQARLRIELDTAADPARLTLTFAGRDDDASVVIDPLVMGFIQQLGWTYSHTVGPARQISVLIPGTELHLLMIDDEEGFISLVRRYLTGSVVQISVARDGAEGVSAAQEGLPDAILLDVMMPGLDGWQVLQTLRTDPRTMHIPIIVCSVFNDPELASSLGADLLLPKPSSQESLLAALRQARLLP